MEDKSNGPARRVARTRTVRLIDLVRRDLAVLARDGHLDDEGQQLVGLTRAAMNTLRLQIIDGAQDGGQAEAAHAAEAMDVPA